MAEGRGRTRPPSVRAAAIAEDARYDSDLAEFPAFRFGKRNLRSGPDRLHYTDQIFGRNREPVVREWTTYRPRLGWGGASTHALLFDLFQLWKEQGFSGNRITFGTLRWLLRRRYPDREPAADDFQRIRRDLRILCGYTFDAKNAFWDPDQKCYRDMEEWSLFTGVAYARPTPDARQEELPFGFIEVSSTLHYIAQRRGFFVTGFDGPFFHGLKPHEQRLSLYLAKMFTSQKVHRRYEEDLYAALPIESEITHLAGARRKQRQTLRQAAQGLLDKGCPVLEAYKVEKSPRHGRWVASFLRKRPIPQDYPVRAPSLDTIEPPELRFLVEEMIEATGDEKSLHFWAQAARALGEHAIRYAIADLRADGHRTQIRNRGALLVTKLQDLARQRGVKISRERPSGSK